MSDRPPTGEGAASQKRPFEEPPNDLGVAWDAPGRPVIEPPEEWLEVVRQYAPQLLRADGTGLILPDDASQESSPAAKVPEAAAPVPVARRPAPEIGSAVSPLREPYAGQDRQAASSPAHTPPDLEYPTQRLRHPRVPQRVSPELRKPTAPDLHIGALEQDRVTLSTHKTGQAQAVKTRHAPSAVTPDRAVNASSPQPPPALPATTSNASASVREPITTPLGAAPKVAPVHGAQPNSPQIEAAPFAPPTTAVPIDPALRTTPLAQDVQQGIAARYADNGTLHRTQLQPAESRWLALPTSSLTRTAASDSASTSGHDAASPADGLAALRANRLRREQQGRA